MQQQVPDGRQLLPPVDDSGDPVHGDRLRPDVVLDFAPADPRILLDRDSLDRRIVGVRIAVQFPGDHSPVLVDLDDTTRDKIAAIGDRYLDVDLPEIEMESSSLAKVQNLIQLQQLIETANVLMPNSFDHAWWKDVRLHLARTNDVYVEIFGRLRDQLRNHRDDGAHLLRLLLNTRVAVLLNLGLRLAELEPSLGARVQRDLASVFADDQLDENLRYRAYQELQGSFRYEVDERAAAE